MKNIHKPSKSVFGVAEISASYTETQDNRKTKHKLSILKGKRIPSLVTSPVGICSYFSASKIYLSVMRYTFSSGSPVGWIQQSISGGHWHLPIFTAFSSPQWFFLALAKLIPRIVTLVWTDRHAPWEMEGKSPFRLHQGRTADTLPENRTIKVEFPPRLYTTNCSQSKLSYWHYISLFKIPCLKLKSDLQFCFYPVSFPCFLKKAIAL